MNRFAFGCIVSSTLALGGFVGSHFRGTDTAQADTRVSSRDTVSYRDIVKKAMPAVVSIFHQKGNRLSFGSGVIVDSRGTILTNCHVVEGATTVTVQLDDGTQFTTTDIRCDKKTDLAVVRISTSKTLPFMQFARNDDVEVGDCVLAIGIPEGFSKTVTHGIVSAKNRNLKFNLYEDYIQTDAAINHGNSGGPLINMDGRIVGINTLSRMDIRGISFSISGDLARNIMETLLREGSVKRAYLGMAILDIDENIAKQLKWTGKGGVVINRIFDNTPAAKYNLHPGDIIRTIDGKAINNSDEFTKTVASLTAGSLCDLAITREGKAISMRVALEAQPEKFGVRE